MESRVSGPTNGEYLALLTQSAVRWNFRCTTAGASSLRGEDHRRTSTDFCGRSLASAPANDAARADNRVPRRGHARAGRHRRRRAHEPGSDGHLSPSLRGSRVCNGIAACASGQDSAQVAHRRFSRSRSRRCRDSLLPRACSVAAEATTRQVPCHGSANE
jgi:hypothetical protein